MIEILVPGRIFFQRTCPRCLCLFRYEESDLAKTIEDNGPYGGPDAEFWIECPFCRKHIRVKPSMMSIEEWRDLDGEWKEENNEQR